VANQSRASVEAAAARAGGSLSLTGDSLAVDECE
jgi:hypothetical protein